MPIVTSGEVGYHQYVVKCRRRKKTRRNIDWPQSEAMRSSLLQCFGITCTYPQGIVGAGGVPGQHTPAVRPSSNTNEGPDLHADVQQGARIAHYLRQVADALQQNLSSLTQREVRVLLECAATDHTRQLTEFYVTVDFDAAYQRSGASRRFHAIRGRYGDTGSPLRRGRYGTVYAHPAGSLVLKVDNDMHEVDPDATGDEISAVLRALMEHFVCGVVATRGLSGTLEGAPGIEEPFPMVVQNTEVACRISVRNMRVARVVRYYEMERYDAPLSRVCMRGLPEAVRLHNEAFLRQVPQRILEHAARSVAYFDFKPEQFLVCYDDCGKLTKLSLTDVDMRFTRFAILPGCAHICLAARVPFATLTSERCMQTLLRQQLAIFSLGIRNWTPEVDARDFMDGTRHIAGLDGTREWEEYVEWTDVIKGQSRSAHRFHMDGCALILSYLLSYAMGHCHTYNAMERQLRSPMRSIGAANALASLRRHVAPREDAPLLTMPRCDHAPRQCGCV